MKELLQVLPPGERDWRLANQIDPERLPSHIAIIMDGNGRWARQRSFPRLMGHRAGVTTVRTVVETCARMKIGTLTLYAFSVENWKRPQQEIEGLWRLLRHFLRRELPTLMNNDIQLNAIGRISGLSDSVQRELDATMEATSRNCGMRLNLAINYG